ncbi:cache domain-containing protein [Kordiimonas sp.]|uniref:cache domain-containing protein n=1 Tax=Kordiimonas sp. TaxID=1970157 RepID=UPI003A9498F6
MNRRTLQSILPFLTAIMLVFAFLYVQERSLSRTLRSQVAETLEHILNTARDSAAAWKQRHITQMGRMPQQPVIIAQTAALLEIKDRRAIFASDALADLRTHMSQILANYGYLGFFVIAPDGTNVASIRDSNIGQINLVQTQMPDTFARVLAGEVLVSEPIRTDVPVVGANGIVSKVAPTMFALAPIRNDGGNIIAVFALRMNPLGEFSALFARNRIGLTGETYAFNRQGLMISESRFTETLKLVGLLQRGEASTLNIPVHDPGFNAFDGSRNVDMAATPPTLMAASALAGKSGQNLEGYRNYLGQTVVGAWLWDDTLGFGIATEMREKEAFAGMNTSIFTIRAFAGCILILLAALAYAHNRNRHRDKTET